MTKNNIVFHIATMPLFITGCSALNYDQRPGDIYIKDNVRCTKFKYISTTFIDCIILDDNAINSHSLDVNIDSRYLVKKTKKIHIGKTMSFTDSECKYDGYRRIYGELETLAFRWNYPGYDISDMEINLHINEYMEFCRFTALSLWPIGRPSEQEHQEPLGFLRINIYLWEGFDYQKDYSKNKDESFISNFLYIAKATGYEWKDDHYIVGKNYSWQEYKWFNDAPGKEIPID